MQVQANTHSTTGKGRRAITTRKEIFNGSRAARSRSLHITFCACCDGLNDRPDQLICSRCEATAPELPSYHLISDLEMVA